MKIGQDKIGALIGPGGKNIRALQEETGTKIDVAEDGTVSISGTDPARGPQGDDTGRGAGREARSATSTPARSCGSCPTGPSSRSGRARMGWSTSPSWTSSGSSGSRTSSSEGDEITVMVIDVDPDRQGQPLAPRRADRRDPPAKEPAPAARAPAVRGWSPGGFGGPRPGGSNGGPRPGGYGIAPAARRPRDRSKGTSWPMMGQAALTPDPLSCFAGEGEPLWAAPTPG